MEDLASAVAWCVSFWCTVSCVDGISDLAPCCLHAAELVLLSRNLTNRNHPSRPAPSTQNRNPRRMQNMILAVGPGTPASEVLKVTDLSSASSSPPTSDDEMLMASDVDSAGDSDDDESDDGDDESGDDSDVDSDDVARGQRRRRWTRKVLETVHAAAAAEAGADANREDDLAMEELLDEKEKEEQAATASAAPADVAEAAAPPLDDSADNPHVVVMARARAQLDRAKKVMVDTGLADDHSHHSCGDLSSSPSSSSRKRERFSRPYLAGSIKRPIAPSMRHGGCVNTAAWLTCPWRLSFANHDNNTLHGGLIVSSSHSANSAGIFSYEQEEDNDDDSDDALPASKVIPLDSRECTTQLITSGDDRVVKFWDVSNAMGGISPYPGGPSTTCPFADSSRIYTTPPEIVNIWKKRRKRGDPIPGAVTPLATLETGHRGNVFHATPLYYQPGKVATCAADGYLRLCDVESGSNSSSSTIVVSPDIDEDGLDMPLGYLRARGGMCFSHHFLDANIGLLCTEHGLKRFDIRLSPREQPSGAVLGGQYSSCKSCAIWSAGGAGMSNEGDCFDSAYVFVGSSSGDVALCDLRMTSNTSSRIVQHYRPSCFSPYEPVAVSGIDISRDQRELLVSYESDQIYSFPVFPTCKSAAGPSVEELASYSAALAAPSCTDETEDDQMGERSRHLPEFASYGGHLNRFTFLKRATFAGPNDEYICTGSDSGHAWIYEKATGAVVSLLKADHSTCNGIVPHPTLPFFATYGIDSTAKLWHATQPVGDDTDDSDLGRFKTARHTKYEASPLVQSWRGTESKLALFSDPDTKENNAFSLLPDEVPSHDDEDDSIFGGLAGVLFRSVSRLAGRQSIPFIANDLASLPNVLLQNYFSCVRAFVSGDEGGLGLGCCLSSFCIYLQNFSLAINPTHIYIIPF